MGKSMKHMIVVTGCALMSACGPTTGVQEVTWDRAVVAQRQLERLDELAPTTENNMPSTGTASYTGSAVIAIDPRSFSEIDNIGIVGDATLEVSFSGPGTVTGRIDNYQAVTGAGSDLQFRVPASGRIDIGLDESQVGTATANNNWGADYRGNINVDGRNYTVDGILTGGFLGNRTSDPTPERITKGIVGTNVPLATQYAIPDTGLPAPIEITVFGEN